MPNAHPVNNSINCPIDSMLGLISAKWTVQILQELSLGSVRTRRFLKLIPGLSMKSLLERLKALHEAGMINRTQFAEKIPHVEYSITERGRRLLDVMSELKRIAAEMAQFDCKCPMETSCRSEIRCPSYRDWV